MSGWYCPVPVQTSVVGGSQRRVSPIQTYYSVCSLPAILLRCLPCSALSRHCHLSLCSIALLCRFGLASFQIDLLTAGVLGGPVSEYEGKRIYGYGKTLIKERMRSTTVQYRRYPVCNCRPR